MKRFEFLKRLGLGGVLAVVAPSVIAKSLKEERKQFDEALKKEVLEKMSNNK